MKEYPSLLYAGCINPDKVQSRKRVQVGTKGANQESPISSRVSASKIVIVSINTMFASSYSEALVRVHTMLKRCIP